MCWRVSSVASSVTKPLSGEAYGLGGRGIGRFQAAAIGFTPLVIGPAAHPGGQPGLQWRKPQRPASSGRLVGAIGYGQPGRPDPAGRHGRCQPAGDCGR